MLKNAKQQRILIAFIFYIIAIGLLIVESLIDGFDLAFQIIIVAPMSYFFYYILISKTVDEAILWPLIVILGMCVFMYGFSDKDYNTLCEILEVVLFVIQIITAFVVKFIREKIFKNN